MLHMPYKSRDPHSIANKERIRAKPYSSASIFKRDIKCGLNDPGWILSFAGSFMTWAAFAKSETPETFTVFDRETRVILPVSIAPQFMIRFYY